MTYLETKKWCLEHKKQFILFGCFIMVFLVGFGTGRYDKNAQAQKRKSPNNYNKTETAAQKTENPAADALVPAATGQVAGQAILGGGEAVKAEVKCVIKGNISASNKIYHEAGGAFYDRTNPEMCFNTEGDAVAAGFRKSSR